MPCESGCLCDTCCEAARAFAYGHWNLQQLEDHAAMLRHNWAWRPLEEGFVRQAHRAAA